MMYREQLHDGEPDALRDCCHDVTTLPALTIHHDRPRRASTTRTAGGRTGLFAESQSSVGNVEGRLFATGRGSYDKAGKVGMGWTVWSVMAYHPWVDAPTPRVHPPCGSSTRSSRQARDRHTGRYWHHFPMSPLAFVFW